MFFLTPNMLLAHMLQAEAKHEAFYRAFPHLRSLAVLYDHCSTPIKLTLLALTRQSKPTASQEA
jgi:hypothetical protein